MSVHRSSPGITAKNERAAQDLAERRARYRRGHFAEFLAVVLLTIKGYRVLGRRNRTHVGEIDLIAVKGATVAFVEVKRRPTRDDALAALTARQSRRMRKAADVWLSRCPRFAGYEQRFDAILVTPGSWPWHIVSGA